MAAATVIPISISAFSYWAHKRCTAITVTPLQNYMLVCLKKLVRGLIARRGKTIALDQFPGTSPVIAMQSAYISSHLFPFLYGLKMFVLPVASFQ